MGGERMAQDRRSGLFLDGSFTPHWLLSRREGATCRFWGFSLRGRTEDPRSVGEGPSSKSKINNRSSSIVNLSGGPADDPAFAGPRGHQHDGDLPARGDGRKRAGGGESAGSVGEGLIDEEVD